MEHLVASVDNTPGKKWSAIVDVYATEYFSQISIPFVVDVDRGG